MLSTVTLIAIHAIKFTGIIGPIIINCFVFTKTLAPASTSVSQLQKCRSCWKQDDGKMFKKIIERPERYTKMRRHL